MATQFEHVVDKFGNDAYYGNTGAVRVPPLPHVTDYVTQLQRIRNLPLREDDVIVVGFPKSGNNWTHHMVSMLQAGSTEVAPMYTEDNFPYLEGVTDVMQAAKPDRPRAFLTHMPLPYLPKDILEKKVKVIYLTRNPKDVIVSLWCHMSTREPPIKYDGTWNQFCEVAIEDGFWYGNQFDYLRKWEKDIDSHPDHPFFIAAYEETKKDTVDQLVKLDAFLGTERDRKLLQAIADTCTVGNMSKTRPEGKKTSGVFLYKKDQSSLYRKGVVGDWKNWFTVAQNEYFHQCYDEKMAGSKRSFNFE